MDKDSKKEAGAASLEYYSSTHDFHSFAAQPFDFIACSEGISADGTVRTYHPMARHAAGIAVSAEGIAHCPRCAGPADGGGHLGIRHHAAARDSRHRCKDFIAKGHTGIVAILPRSQLPPPGRKNPVPAAADTD